ncbi:MAG: DUF6603 domain-containing protein [Gemmatimonadaceae bacterium]
MADDDKAKKKKNIFSRIIGWFKDTADDIVELFTDGAIARSIREDLGLKPGEQIPAEKSAKFKAFASGLDPDKEALSETIAEVQAVVQEIKALATTLETVDTPAAQVSYLLLSLAATDSIRLRLPMLFAFARDILFLEDDTEKLMIIDPARMFRSLRGEDLPSGEQFAQRISFASALILQLFDAFQSKEEDGQAAGHVDVFYGWDPSPDSKTPKADVVQQRTTTISIGDDTGTGASLQVTMLYVPPDHGGPGLFLALGGGLKVVKEEENATYRLDTGFSDAFDIYIPFGDGPLPLTVQGGGATPFLKFGITGGTPDTPAFRIGEPTGTRLDVYESELGIDVWKESAGVHAALRNAELVIAPGSGDGFLRDIAGDGAKVRFSVGMIVDSDGGFRLDGGTKASATLAVGRSISGVLTVHHVEIALGPSSTGGDFGLELSGAFTANIGPFSATVDRMGFQLDVDRRENGNLGPLNLGLGFKEPSGLGLRLDAGFVKGGGYLYHDPANGEYAGALELQFGKFSLKAIGMIKSSGDTWSLLLFVYGQFPPIQLGFGFTLDGVGGMIGVRHGIDIPQLIAGMKTKAFDDILFPANPVADAPRILNRLRTLFPPSPSSLTIGPMVDLGFGTPRIVFIRLAVLFQIDNVFGRTDETLARIVLIGQLRVEIGKTKGDKTVSVVKLVVDILGFWDYEKKRYGFLAALRDSKIAGIDIFGGLGVWGDYGEQPRFLLAAGGFNARFKDIPAEISGAIPRLGASFKVGRFSLTLVGYFALTPGTLQFGVELTATAKIGPVGVKGLIGFDVLIYRTPYTHFIADFRVSVEVTYKGHSLAAVKCVGIVEGPGLWHVKGKVTFSILWWDIDKSFDESWGELPEAAIAAASVRDLLQAELARKENWSAQLPAGSEAMVTLAPRVGETVPLAHPLGRFAFSQRVVPLGLSLQHFDEAKISGPNRFDVTSLVVGSGTPAVRVPIREHFARAQFVEVSEEDKLTRPSFEEMDAGVEFSSDAFRTSASVITNDMEYETAYLEYDATPFTKTRRDVTLRRIAIDHDLILVLALHGAAARAPQRADERMRARTQNVIEIGAAPLAAADRSSFGVDTAISMNGQARSVAMIAEQRFNSADEQRSQLVEAFELALA